MQRVRRWLTARLVAAIDEYIAHHNTNPKPFIWTKSARDIQQKVIRANSRLSSKQNATLHWPPASAALCGTRWPSATVARVPGPAAHMPSDLSSSSVSLEGTGGRGISASGRVCAISASGSGGSCGSKSYSLMNSVRSMASSR